MVSDERKKLNLVAPLLIIFVIVVSVSVSALILSHVSEKRNENLYNAYANEANSYIAKNQANLEKLFVEVIPDENICVSGQPCPKADSGAISNLLPKNLKDWSSTMLVKKGKGDSLIVAKLDGSLSYIPNREGEEKDIRKLLSGEVDKIPVADYVYDLRNTEAVIPVKNKDGKIIGALIRGVIE